MINFFVSFICTWWDLFKNAIAHYFVSMLMIRSDETPPFKRANSQLENYRKKGSLHVWTYVILMYVHTTYMTYIWHTYMTCTYMTWYYIHVYMLVPTRNPALPTIYKRYISFFLKYYLSLFIDKKPCPANYFLRFQ